ncbi:MAG: hypothetical protein AAFV95_27965 [Bacteroidota bacterium]
MKNYLLTFLLLALLSSCAKQYTPANYTGSRIEFGSGGGITGAVTRYVLLENGQLFRQQGPDTSFQEATARLDKSVVKQKFDNYKFLKLSDVQYQQPDNMYYFVQHQEGDQMHTITWGGAAPNLPTDVKIFYRNLNQLTKQLRFKD